MSKNLLLIDDDEDEKLIFCEALQALKTNFSCIYASGPAEAFELLGSVRPVMIFVDYNMPRMNGLDCVKLLRNMSFLKKQPIILYSTYISESTLKLAETNGVSACVEKPKTFEDLKTMLSNVLQEQLGVQHLLPSLG